MSDPHVFHLITRLLKGGAEAKTLTTVRELDDYTFTVGFGHEFDDEQVASLRGDGVETVSFRSIRHYNPVTTVPAVLAVARELHRRSPDILHTHSTEAGIISRFAAALAGVPAVVHTVHGIPFADDRNAVLNRFVLTCERAAARVTDRMVTNADKIADDYLAAGIGTPDQYKTVYSGIDIRRFQSADPAVDLPGGRPRITMVARLADGKGFDVLFEALERLDATGYSVALVGDGPLADTLDENITASGLDDTVFRLGYRSDIPAVLAASDVFVLPSYREGTPRVITEAMAAGLPVVATNIAGIPEQVTDGESGYLVEPGDAAAVATALEDLLADDDRREAFGAFAQDRVKQFSTESMVRDIDAVYRSLLRSTADREE